MAQTKRTISGREATDFIHRLRARIASLEAELKNLHALFKTHVEQERKKADIVNREHEVEVVRLKGQIALLEAKLGRV
jgi:hypothetical protein